jgi:hypothetical protein
MARKAPVIGVWDALILGIPPVLAAGFLGWITYKSLPRAPASEI